MQGAQALKINMRGVLYFTLSEIEPRAWITLTECNFRCRGCFSPARDAKGKMMYPEETLAKLNTVCTRHYGFIPEEVLITGGEPTITKEYLLSLIDGLKRLGALNIVLCTNGYEIGRDEVYGKELARSGLREVHLDIKAYDEKLHQWYAGKSNIPVLKAVKNLIDAKIDLTVQTVYIPQIVEVAEIKKIAAFLAGINPEIKYRIDPFEPRFSYEQVARSPTQEEMEIACEAASEYLPNTILSMSCRREFTKEPGKSRWITVYPDLTVKRRDIKEYEDERRKEGARNGLRFGNGKVEACDKTNF